jgi:hypothetical protein
MKLTSITVLAGIWLAGCATGSVKPLTNEQITSVRYTKRDCAQIDYHINTLEAQLRMRGLVNKDPESMNEADRTYNATTRIAIWNLRIGCNNPNRFAKK